MEEACVATSHTLGVEQTPENRQFGRLSHLFYPLTFAFKMLSLVLPSVRNFIKKERKEDQRQTQKLESHCQESQKIERC